jgi:hypothetical protein
MNVRAAVLPRRIVQESDANLILNISSLQKCDRTGTSRLSCKETIGNLKINPLLNKSALLNITPEPNPHPPNPLRVAATETDGDAAAAAASHEPAAF